MFTLVHGFPPWLIFVFSFLLCSSVWLGLPDPKTTEYYMTPRSTSLSRDGDLIWQQPSPFTRSRDFSFSQMAIKPPSKTKDIMQWCGHPSSSANIPINSVHMTCLSSRARSEVFIGMSVISLHYSPSSRAQTHSLMDSQCASKLLIPILTIRFMTPPREAVVEKVPQWLHSSRNQRCAARMHAAREQFPLFLSQSLSWSHDLAFLFHNQPHDAVRGLRPQLGRSSFLPPSSWVMLASPLYFCFSSHPSCSPG